MKAVLPGLFPRGLVPKGVLVSQGDRAGVVGVVVDELEVLEDLPPLFGFAHVGSVVVDGEHNRPTCRGDFLSVNDVNVHQQSEGATFDAAAEVVAGVQLAPIPTNKKVRCDVLDVVAH